MTIIDHRPATARGLRRPGDRPARAGRDLRSYLALNVEVAAEDAELVARVQAGMATTGWAPGPLGEREAAVAWFAGHVRRALETGA